MAATDEGLRKVLSAANRSPLSAATLVSVIIGGASVYWSLVSSSEGIRKELLMATERGITTNQRQDFDIAELKNRVKRAEDLADSIRISIEQMRADVREINTNIKWITRGNVPNP